MGCSGISKEVLDVREAWLRKNFHGFMGEVLDEAKKTYTQVISRASNGKNYGLLAPFVPNWMRLQDKKATGAQLEHRLDYHRDEIKLMLYESRIVRLSEVQAVGNLHYLTCAEKLMFLLSS
ncbi:hypothetical protein Tco_1540716 [Tanacetum coccineum]